MDAVAIASALFVFAGIGIIAAALSRWGRTGVPQRRVGGMMLVGSGALLAGASAMAGGSTAAYGAAAAVVAVGLLLLATRRSREPGRSLPRLRRRR